MNAAAAAWPTASCLFWLALAFILYTYGVYPLLMALWARLRPRPVARRAGFRPSLSIIVAAHNEAPVIARRIDNLLSQDYPRDLLEVIAVSDGSTDATADVLRQALTPGSAAPDSLPAPRLRLIILPENQGKAAALNAAVAAASGELIVFTDARQCFAPDAVVRLAENFADPAVGSASGELMLAADGGVATQVGLYWKYEKWIRHSESDAGSMLGATGAIYAIRRALWRPLPPGTLLDDFLVPKRIVLAGYRSILDGRAVAWDQAEDEAAREFRRKVRTLAGNFQSFALEPGMLFPWRNPATWFQVWSHKVFRLLVPYALMLLFVTSLLSPGPFYTLAAGCQGAFYAAALTGHFLERLGHKIRSRTVSLAYTFTVLNAAAAAGLFVWLQRRSARQLWR